MEFYTKEVCRGWSMGCPLPGCVSDPCTCVRRATPTCARHTESSSATGMASSTTSFTWPWLVPSAEGARGGWGAPGPWKAGQVLRWGLRLGWSQKQYGKSGGLFRAPTRVDWEKVLGNVTGGWWSALSSYHCAPGQPFLSLDGRSDCSVSHSPSCGPFHSEQIGEDQSWGSQNAPWALASALCLGMDICLLVIPSFPTQEEVPEPWTVLAGVLRHEHPGVSPRKHPW